MLVGTQKLMPGTFTHHLVARAHRKAGKRKLMILSLMLTPMVDMFSLLVIFLLQTFSASPELLIAKGVTLPGASTGREIKDAPVLSLSPTGVYLDQKSLGSIDSILKDPDPLMEGLEGLRQVWQKSHPKGKFPGEINLQAHRDLPSTKVSMIMAMLPSQAFGSIQLAVISGSRSSGGSGSR